MRIAIAGSPGSGKTTLATALSEHFGWPVVSAGDVARQVDPASLAMGEMANERGFMEAFLPLLDTEHAIFDGFPRTERQMQTLPADVLIIELRVHPDIARKRLLRRGRPDDEWRLVDKRIRKQNRLIADWLAAVSDVAILTNDLSPDEVRQAAVKGIASKANYRERAQ